VSLILGYGVYILLGKCACQLQTVRDNVYIWLIGASPPNHNRGSAPRPCRPQTPCAQPYLHTPAAPVSVTNIVEAKLAMHRLASELAQIRRRHCFDIQHHRHKHEINMTDQYSTSIHTPSPSLTTNTSLISYQRQHGLNVTASQCACARVHDVTGSAWTFS